MLVVTEAKAQLWRAVAVIEGHGEALILVGRSSTQIRGEYTTAFSEMFEEDEDGRNAVTAIYMQQWQGAPDAGSWLEKAALRVPSKAKVKVAA